MFFLTNLGPPAPELLRGDCDLPELLRGDFELVLENFNLFRATWRFSAGISFSFVETAADRSPEGLALFSGYAARFRCKSGRSLSNDATPLRGDPGRPREDLKRSRGYLASRGGDVKRLGRKRRLVLLRDSFGGEDCGGDRTISKKELRKEFVTVTASVRPSSQTKSHITPPYPVNAMTLVSTKYM